MFRKTPQPRIQGIVLDAVGTLIEPRPTVAEAYQCAATRQGVRLNADLIRRRFGSAVRSDETLLPAATWETSEATERDRWRRIVRLVLLELPDFERAFTELWDHFGQPTAWRLFEDVAPAIAVLQSAGVALVIGSNFDARLRHVIAGLPEIAELERALVISSEVGVRKPDPRFFHVACDRLNCEPSTVLCIGDDMRNDVLAAREAGANAVLLDRLGRHREHDGDVLTDLYGLAPKLQNPS
jgi:putative hydrolase of the HAD superfamily